MIKKEINTSSIEYYDNFINQGYNEILKTYIEKIE